MKRKWWLCSATHTTSLLRYNCIERLPLLLWVVLILSLSVLCCRFLRLSQLPWLPVQRTHSIMRRPGSVWRSWPSTSNLSATPEVLKTHTHKHMLVTLIVCSIFIMIDTLAAFKWNSGCCFQHGKSSTEYSWQSHGLRCENTAARWLLMDVALFPFQKWCTSLCFLHVSVLLGTWKG